MIDLLALDVMDTMPVGDPDSMTFAYDSAAFEILTDGVLPESDDEQLQLALMAQSIGSGTLAARVWGPSDSSDVKTRLPENEDWHKYAEQVEQVAQTWRRNQVMIEAAHHRVNDAGLTHHPADPDFAEGYADQTSRLLALEMAIPIEDQNTPEFRIFDRGVRAAAVSDFEAERHDTGEAFVQSPACFDFVNNGIQTDRATLALHKRDYVQINDLPNLPERQVAS